MAESGGVAAAVLKTAVDFLAGSAAGFACKVVEYPFDTVKVLQQTADTKETPKAWECFFKVLRERGFFGLYRGLASPLVGSMAENAVLFTSFGMGKQIFGGLGDENAMLPKVLAGSFAGVCAAHVLTPVELIKVKLQYDLQNANNKEFKPKYAGPIDCLRKTIATEGVAKGLFKGHMATLLRETPGNAAWFGVYEFVSMSMVPEGGKRSDLKGWQNMLAGGLAGMSYWSAFYPADTVKSKMQSADASGQQRSFAWWFKHLYENHGVRGLYKGWGITVSRAVPSNATLFFVYELTTKHMKDDEPKDTTTSYS